MNKNYNYERKKLFLPEYGRHIHEMVDYLMTIEDREERNRQARLVIAVMGNLNTTLRDTADLAHKLWDHLFIMADFQLDVDSPYPIPSRSSLSARPEKMPYPAKRIMFKHYGKNIERILRSLEWADRRATDEVISNVARFMRAKSYEYNEEHPNNEAIIKDIKRMSENRITVDEIALNNLKSDYKQFQTPRNKKSPHQNKKQKNGKSNNLHRRPVK